MCIILILMIQVSLFAGGNRESPTRHNVYGRVGYSAVHFEETNYMYGFGYEYAFNNIFSFGAYLGGQSGEGEGFDFFLKPRIYFGNSALENFFIGANIGYVTYYNYSSGYNYFYDDYYDNSWGYDGLEIGLNLGYKFVFGDAPGGFSLEPSIGYDFNLGRYNLGVAMGYAFGGGGTREAPAPRQTSRVRDGIYVGIIVFGREAEDITGGRPIYLDAEGFNRLNNLIDSHYRRASSTGTALFYASHLGLANMKRAESMIPRNLRSATLVTFTDGIDVSSTGLSQPIITDPGNTGRLQFRGGELQPYQEFVKQEINNRKINGTQVDAYIMAVQGDDITDVQAFSSALRFLSTSEAHIFEGNMAGLDREFAKIAGNIVDDWAITSFTVITPEFPRRTRVRMTFAGENTSAQAQNARIFLEGEIDVRNDGYYLTNITYSGGLSSSISQGGEIKGESKNGEVEFNFPNFSGFTFPQNQTEVRRILRQFIMNAGSTAWQLNSEYDPVNVSRRIVQRNNAIVYLVLDNSTSISPADIPRVQNSAKGFIRRLYEAYHQ